MAKNRFERQVVLDQAVDLFWQVGYGGCSIQKLSGVTGLQVGSLYHAFVNKEGLFRAVISRYAEQSQTVLRDSLSAAPSIVQGVARVLFSVMSQSCARDYCGCLLIKTQLELSISAPDLSALATEKLQENEILYRKALAEVYPVDEAEHKARQVMMAIFALRVYGYQSQSQTPMREAVQALLPWVPLTREEV